MLNSKHLLFRFSFLLFFLFLTAVSTFFLPGCAKRPPRTLLNGSLAGPMTATLSTRPDSTGVPRSAVKVSIPCSAMVFKKQKDQIVAGLEVSVSAFSGERFIGGGVSTHKINLPHWNAVKPDSLLTVHVPLQLGVASKAVLEVQARSLYSSRFWQQQLAYEVWPWKQIPLELLDFQWNLEADRTLTTQQDTLAVDLLVKETLSDLV